VKWIYFRTTIRHLDYPAILAKKCFAQRRKGQRTQRKSDRFQDFARFALCAFARGIESQDDRNFGNIASFPSSMRYFGCGFAAPGSSVFIRGSLLAFT